MSAALPRHSPNGGDDRSHKTGRRAAGYERDGLACVLLKMQSAALASLHLSDKDRFLDVGCATGSAVRTAAATTGCAIGVDVSGPMIQRARTQSSASTIRFVLADARRLPFRPAAFSAVLCTSVLTYMDSPADVVAEILRVTDPLGRIALGCFDPYGWPNCRSQWDKVTVVADQRLLTALGYYRITVMSPR